MQASGQVPCLKGQSPLSSSSGHFGGLGEMPDHYPHIFSLLKGSWKFILKKKRKEIHF